jgi:ABC-type transport system substrate-binding protein
MGVLLVVSAIVSGCLTLDEPSPTAEPSLAPRPTTAATQPPRDQDALIVAVPTYPGSLLPPATDETSQLLLDLLYDPLYRLDERLVARPRLAADLPIVSEDGTTWTVDLAPADMRFGDGTPVTSADVVASLRIARSPTCSLDRDLCATALQVLDSVEALDDRRVRLTLTQPYAPFLAEVLAQLPILEEAGLQTAAASMVQRAAAIPADAPDKLVTRIYQAVGDDGCLVEQPPAGCDLSDHTPELEQMLTQAGIALPSTGSLTNDTGLLDEAAYANALLDRVASLGQVLSRTGIDRLAAAIPLMDLSGPSLGSGAYRVSGMEPGVSVELTAIPGHVTGPPGIAHITLQVIADPAVAATRLMSGDVDWLLRTDAQQADAIQAADGVSAGLRPLPAQWTIVFNTRKGRLYSDPGVRRAFAMCVDRAGLTGTLGGGEAIVASTPLAPGSWAMTPPGTTARDVATAGRLLDQAGWTPGSDGIRVRGDHRLSSSIALRSSQASMLAFAQGAAGQLRECGIELLVEDLDLTGDSLLEQLRWPNHFDTLLTMRALGPDPDHDLQAFESSHATSAEQEVDANPGGFRSAEADELIDQGRRTTDQVARTELYGRLQAVLDREVPAWSIWYDTSWAAISDRVRGPGGAIDTSLPGYDWDVPSWTLDPSAP